MGNGFDNIGVERALGKEFHADAAGFNGVRFLLENIDKGMSDNFPFFFRVVNACQFIEKKFACVHIFQIQIKVFP